MTPESYPINARQLAHSLLAAWTSGDPRRLEDEILRAEEIVGTLPPLSGGEAESIDLVLAIVERMRAAFGSRRGIDTRGPRNLEMAFRLLQHVAGPRLVH